tara:strand:+ start:424 stop:1029 length:606 start_codon:yes stop_codon:yes gene_type:complete
MSTYNAIKYNVSFANAGGLKLIKTLTASSSSTLSFVDGSSNVVLDSTYKTYLFIFNNIHPATDNADFTFNMSTDSGSNYNVTKTSTAFRAFNTEGDSGSLDYNASYDLAQGTGYQPIAYDIGDDADHNANGLLYLFSPSSTTFVKHFLCTSAKTTTTIGGLGTNDFYGGYGNTTSAVDAVQFKMSSGNIDAGTIQLFGVVS